MLESKSSLIISENISLAGAGTAATIPFILFSDPNAKFEFVWTLVDGLIDSVGIKWTGAQVGSIHCTSATISILGENHKLPNSLILTRWNGKKFPETMNGSLMSTGYFNYKSIRVLTEFSGISAMEGIIDTDPSRYIKIHSHQGYQLSKMNDVRIYFSTTRSDLWTTEALLIQSSDYFETLFSSEFAERALLTEIRNDSVISEKDFDDSEDEEEKKFDDSEEEEKNEISGKSTSIAAVELKEVKKGIKAIAPFKQIKIDAIAHSTYLAFLHWIETYEITFAPLSSNYRLDPNPTASRRAAMDKLVEDSTLPRSVSPKSIYRLAHYYNIPLLKELAFISIKEQITVENVAFEIFDETSSRYEEIGDICLDFSVNNWDEIYQSKAMEEVERLVEIGQMKTPSLLFKILRKSKATKK